MNLFALIKPALVVLQHGYSLKNVENWKNSQLLINLGTAIFALLVPFVPALSALSGQSDELISGIAFAIVAVVNAYLTIATSKKVGVVTSNVQSINSDSVRDCNSSVGFNDAAGTLPLPEIELVGRATSSSVAAPIRNCGDDTGNCNISSQSTDRVCRSLPSSYPAEYDERGSGPGWNG